MGRRVVITAMGLVSSLGDTPRAICRSVQSRRVTFQYSEIDPSCVVAPIHDFDVRKYTGRHKNLRYLHRGSAMAAAAAAMAVRNADLASGDRERAGLFVGAGPNLDLGAECARIEKGRIEETRLPALWILKFLPNTAASAIAQINGLHGENLTVGNACAASLQAVGEAFRKVRDGYLDVALAGGGDSRLNAGALLAYQKAQALYSGDAAPLAASRPFDAARQGFVPGEGGAFFVLESADHSVARRAKVLAEVCGYGATMDGHAMTAPRPDGRWADKAVLTALKDAGLASRQVGLISTHGTGTPLNDEVEAELIGRLFGDHQPLVSAIKSWIGHLASACGAVELAICLSAFDTGAWPVIRNLETPCRPELNYLRSDDTVPSGVTLLQNFGFGGQNAALIVKPWQP